MNVAMYYNNKEVRIQQQSIPSLLDGEILVKIMASGLCGSDVMEWYRIKKAPLVLGHEISGIVEQVGKDVDRFKPGDRVFVTHHVPCNTCRYCLHEDHTNCHLLHSTTFYPGGFAEYVRVPAINVDRGTFLLPDSLGFDEGTFIEPLACVIRGFRKARFTPARSVLILGSGIAGMLHIKLAKAYGATKIFATDLSKYRLSLAKKIGADNVFHATDDVKSLLRTHNDNRLADLVVLAAGVPAAVNQAFSCVEPGGTILLFAPTKPGEKISLDLFDIWNKQIHIVSTYAGVGKDILDAIDLLSSSQVTVDDLITHRLPLIEAQKGFELVAEADESMKVILHPHEK
ncbi:MAG: alcohol dehydrogenase catalytic domain-containing protein [Candidatus Thermoplasmatota archaeon]|nr:alcohol dehydrogenase catalytic domain-containing protein [Candidatus Thermoplasmatota archaeon]